MKNVLITFILLFNFTMNSQVIKYPIDTVYKFEYPTHMAFDVAREWRKVKPTGSGTYLDSADRFWVVDTSKLTMTIYNEPFQIIDYYCNGKYEFIIDYCQKYDNNVTRTIWFLLNNELDMVMLYTIARINSQDLIPNQGGWSMIKQEEIHTQRPLEP